MAAGNSSADALTDCLSSMKAGPLFLLDGNNMAFRAFYALPAEISTSAGFPTNALYGFTSMIIKILNEYRPGVVIVAWDCREKTFRHQEFEEYKAQRKAMPEPLSEQWPFFTELTDAFGFINLAVPGYEADDILGTLACQAEAEKRETYIVTGDRDALQLAGEHVRIMANTRGVTDVKIYDPAAVVERFGVSPDLIPDFIGLKGDSSDNIPGVPGIGEKTAAQLLEQFGSLDGVLAHIDEVPGAKRRQVLEEHRETALLSRRLALIDVHVPLGVCTAEVADREVQRDKVEALFARLEFDSLRSRVEPLFAGSETKPEAAAGDPLPAPVDAPYAEDGWETLFDWARPVGAATSVDGAAEDAAAVVWLAQPPAAMEVGTYAATVTVGLADVDASASTIAPLLTSAGLVCHDFKGQPLLWRLTRQIAHDTRLAAYLLDPSRREYGLADLAREAGVAWPAAAASAALQAAAQEAAVVPHVAVWQEARLREQGMWELFREIELPLTAVLIAMERTGIYLDCYRLGEIAGKVQDQLDELETRIYDLASGPFNLGSPQQLGRVLFEQLGLPWQRKTKTGYSTDARTLEALRDSHPIVGHLLSHRELSKLMSTYLLALPPLVDPESKRLHTTFNQMVTATGRLSSSDPNLQNIPVRTTAGAQIRQCFRAQPGYLFVVADYSQIELRIMAQFSDEPVLLESFRRGEDIHTRTAAEVFGVPEGQVDSTHRRYAKAVNFGIMYGISAFGLAQNLGVEREEAAAYIQTYFERLPQVKAFIDRTIERAKRDGYVATAFGRRRAIPELSSTNHQTRALGERLAVNSVIQGTAADIIKVAMIRCHERLGRDFAQARLVLQVHDELVFEVPEGQAEDVRVAVVEELVAAYPIDPPLGVDTGIGIDWFSAK